MSDEKLSHFQWVHQINADSPIGVRVDGTVYGPEAIVDALRGRFRVVQDGLDRNAIRLALGMPEPDEPGDADAERGAILGELETIRSLVLGSDAGCLADALHDLRVEVTRFTSAEPLAVAVPALIERLRTTATERNNAVAQADVFRRDIHSAHALLESAPAQDIAQAARAYVQRTQETIHRLTDERNQAMRAAVNTLPAPLHELVIAAERWRELGEACAQLEQAPPSPRPTAARIVRELARRAHDDAESALLAAIPAALACIQVEADDDDDGPRVPRWEA